MPGTNRSETQPTLHPVRIVRHVRIPMSDGVELDADLYLPDVTGTDRAGQFPAVFDYYPYRKDDLPRADARA